MCARSAGPSSTGRSRGSPPSRRRRSPDNPRCRAEPASRPIPPKTRAMSATGQPRQARGLFHHQALPFSPSSACRPLARAVKRAGAQPAERPAGRFCSAGLQFCGLPGPPMRPCKTLYAEAHPNQHAGIAVVSANRRAAQATRCRTHRIEKARGHFQCAKEGEIARAENSSGIS